ncbi:uncharacterized conserved protein [Bellilinea caldifistulae]|uniref:DUF364 domain-containing protein n=1 Tax=Bellilinea caldifistulae TaxID=360411 RepID=A0A0P6X4B4_9CHLR|nr:DUF364 domain-containing protein [Bellilinea caldifistulae]KPL76329.1 hypothetical protein AC812_06595 [Bellilinea caldifistulae]GAP12009.1 uncharacterized conserved protein [Bellilinea caldifistulae]
MTLIEALLKTMPAEPVAVREVMVGVNWTAVCSRQCGLAATLRNEGEHGSNRIRDVGSLHLKTAQELAGWLKSENPLEASLGMAAVNSLLPPPPENLLTEINAFDYLQTIAAGKTVVMVGHFPQVEKLRHSGARVLILEKQPRERDLPAEAAPDVVPLADILAITGMTLVNHTLEDLLGWRSPHSLVMLLGPSTPLTPLLFDFGIHLISGTQIVDEQAALLTIQQGAAFPQVKGTRLVTLSRLPV